MKKIATFFGLLLMCTFVVPAQKPEVTISLNETFFDSLLDAIYQNAQPIEFALASNDVKPSTNVTGMGLGFAAPAPACKEAIQLLRENNGVRTAVRFRDGRILAPLAFSGNYNPPFVGCVPFSGFAETVIDLEFEPQNQRVVARARVQNVSLNGTGGVGGNLIAKMVQGSIDKKVNPIEIFTMDKISFLLPVRRDVNLRMKAASVRHEIVNGALNIVIAYDFVKA